MKLDSRYNYEKEPVFQKTVRTREPSFKRDTSKSKERKHDWSKQRNFKKQEQE